MRDLIIKTNNLVKTEIKKRPDKNFLLIVIGFGIILLFWNLWLPLTKQSYSTGDPKNHDLFAYYVAGKSNNLGLDPYKNNGAAHDELYNPRKGAPGYSKYIYPPTFLPIYSLLAFLDYDDARIFWIYSYFTIFIITFIFIVSWVPPPKRLRIILIGTLLILTSRPLLLLIRAGQVDLIVASLIISSFVTYLRGKPLVSAVFLSVATLIKVNPIFFLATFVILFKDFRYVIYYSVSSIVLFFLSLLFIPIELYSEYFVDILPTIAQGSSYVYNQSLVRFLEPILAKSIYWLDVRGVSIVPEGFILGLFSLAGVSVFALGIILFTNRWSDSSIRLGYMPIEKTGLDFVIFFMNLLVILLVSSITWQMAYVWVILPLSIVMAYIYDGVKLWYFILFGISAVLLNSVVYEEPIQDSLNMIGAILSFVLLGILLYFPRWVVRNKNLGEIK